YETRREADGALGRVLEEAAQETLPTLDPAITVGDYAGHWFATLEAGVKAGTLKTRTAAHYAAILGRHVLPTLRRRSVRELALGHASAAPRADGCPHSGGARGTVGRRGACGAHATGCPLPRR